MFCLNTQFRWRNIGNVIQIYTVLENVWYFLLMYQNFMKMPYWFEIFTIMPRIPHKGKNPTIITFYNLTNGGVYKIGKHSAFYKVSRKTRHWPLKVLFSDMIFAEIKSYTIHSMSNKKKLRIRQHMQSITGDLVQENIQRILFIWVCLRFFLF